MTGNKEMKIVVNKQFGGFGLSDEAIQRYGELAGLKLAQRSPPEGDAFSNYKFWVDVGGGEEEELFSIYSLDRADPILVQVVEEMGPASFGRFSTLEIVDVPDEISWELED